MSLIKEVVRSNERQKEITAEKFIQLAGGVEGKTISILGLAFKAETDDIRESPAITIAQSLLDAGARIQAHDPEAGDNFKAFFQEKVSVHVDAFDALKGADALLILTEWNAYRNLDLSRAAAVMRGRVIMDARNVLEPEMVREAGFVYKGVGR
jgi:UDPglucose 6-dehydrogenase